MNRVCAKGKCTGCKACIDICPKEAISFEDNLICSETKINNEKCIGCGLCGRVCQANNPPSFSMPAVWYQGWANDQKIRENASSGGIASALSVAFINNGGVVCSCLFKDGDFQYQIINRIDELEKFAGSKYVKSNPIGVYKSVKNYLRQGVSVLFIGLPCHVAAVRNYVGNTLEVKLYTVDLICHGTPSIKVLDRFLKQYHFDLKSIQDLNFRQKTHFQVRDGYKGIVIDGGTDRYSLAFLNSLIYTENCYECKYARIERTSDITIGDSWESELSSDEKKKGISLILCQTQKGMELVNNSNLCLKSVNLKKAISANHQLQEPSSKPKYYNDILKQLQRGEKFNRVVFHYLPWKCIKQDIKQLLLRVKHVGGGKIIYSLYVKNSITNFNK